MAFQSSALIGELTAQLDRARSLVGQLSNAHVGPGCAEPSLKIAAPDSHYREAEKRANAAEAQVAKLQRELEQARNRASEAVRETQRLAYQDPLTGLANGHLLLELTDKLLRSTAPGRQLLVIIIDLDRFCVINQMLGHELGDQLLMRVGERLLEVWGPGAALGRLNEDEFVLVLSDIPYDEAHRRAMAVGETIRQELGRPYLLQAQQIHLTVSQGGALGSPDSVSARALFAQARVALDEAKAQGRDQFRVYNPELDRTLRRDASLELQLRYALECDELFVEYLPTVWVDQLEGNKARGRVIAVEAMLRWQHRTEGILLTGDFLQAAERSGQSVAIGDKVMEIVCRDFESWRQADLDLYANIRLSPRQLLTLDLVDRAIHRVTQANIPRDRLTFEIDETFGSLDEEQIDRNLFGLRSAGFTLTLSNFGSGVSSLRRLQQVSFLKLSPDLIESPELCQQALTIATGLGKVAVGVEVSNVATARYLMENGCRTMQGKPFSGPVAAADMLELGRSDSTWLL